MRTRTLASLLNPISDVNINQLASFIAFVALTKNLYLQPIKAVQFLPVSLGETYSGMLCIFNKARTFNSTQRIRNKRKQAKYSKTTKMP